MTQPDQQLTELPVALSQRLKDQEKVSVMVPRRVDQRIVSEAQTYFAPRSAGKRPRWALPVAASVLLALIATGTFRSEDRLLRDDIDGSGHTDVLDVFALARMRRTDPSVSQARIDGLLARIVALDTRGS